MTKRPSRTPLDADAAIQFARIADRLRQARAWRRYQPLPPPTTDDERRERDEALGFCLDRLEIAIDLEMAPPRGK
jgi:hypothetical protein